MSRNYTRVATITERRKNANVRWLARVSTTGDAAVNVISVLRLL